MNTLTDLLLGVGQPRVSHFPDLCTLLYTYLSTLDYWTKIVYYLFTQTSPVAHTSALTPTYIKSQKLPNWPISKELGLGRMLFPHWKLLLSSWYNVYFSCFYDIWLSQVLIPSVGHIIYTTSRKPIRLISIHNYRQVSNIRRTKSQHSKDSRTVLRLSLPNPLKPDVKSRMKM